MRTYNPFLIGSAQIRGGGIYLENPASVENIAGQTLARPLDPFESQLADALMDVFCEEIWELEAIVAALTARGCRDSAGSVWTADSLRRQLDDSAARVFQPDLEPQPVSAPEAVGEQPQGGLRPAAGRDDVHSRDELIAARLDAGLHNLWYPAVPSWMVRSAPVGITRLGRRIVLWRNSAGSVQAIEDRCPHRGARLSQGWNVGDRVACAYHGIEIDGRGVVGCVPAVQDSRLEGRKCNLTYPVTERAGVLFLWFGDDTGSEPTPLELPEELNGGEWSQIVCTAHWRCNYRYALDNVMDPMHGAYLHAVSHSMAQGDKTAVMQIHATERGFIFEKTNQRGVNFDWTEFGSSGVHWLRLAIPYRTSAGPGGAFTIVGMVTPVDIDSCRVFFWRCRKVSGWQKDAWRFLYRARLESLHWEVLEQDRVILEGMVGNARTREMLYPHDAGLVRLRQILKREATAQIDAELSRTPAAAVNGDR